MTATAGPGDSVGAALSPQEAEALAARHGLSQVGTRPSLPAYVRDVWRHRHLMWELAKGNFVASHQDNYLGLLWAVINPLMLGVSYYLIFGILIGTRGGIENFVVFLTAGLFTFIPISSAITTGGRALLSRMGMMRSLRFPRVLLPITVVLSEFLSAVPAFLTLLLIAVAVGEPVTLSWLLFPVALLIVLVFSLGVAMLVARLVHAVRDASNLLPLVVRLLRYVSGVFFSVSYSMSRFPDAPAWVGYLLEYQPVAVMLTMVRETLMRELPVDPTTWLVAGGWALTALLLGFVVFWRGEASYGRA